MATLILARYGHSHTESDTSDLSETGYRQATSVGLKLGAYSVSLAVAAEQKRAQNYMKGLLSMMGHSTEVTLVTAQELNEQDESTPRLQDHLQSFHKIRVQPELQNGHDVLIVSGTRALTAYDSLLRKDLPVNPFNVAEHRELEFDANLNLLTKVS